MKKLFLLLAIIIMASCSKDEDCSYRGAKEDAIIKEMATIETQMETASASEREVYQKQLDRLQLKLTEELKICD